MAEKPETIFPVYLVRGDDPTVTADAVRELVASLVGDLDPTLVVEDLAGDDYDMRAVVDAVQTPAFLSERRVVVARGVGRFASKEAEPLVAYVADPMETTVLVLTGGGGHPVARGLVDAVRKHGHVVDAGIPTGRARSGWLTAQLRRGPVKLDGPATAMLQEHLGEDVARVGALLRTLAAAYGEGARVGVSEMEPFVGPAGSVAPWELTDAIDRGDTAAALEHLHRLIGAGGRHALVIMATLHAHYGRMLRLDGAGVGGEQEAAAALGLTGSTYPAKKALAQARKLGSPAIARAITLLSDADLALRGTVDWPPELVLEVLVARLSRLGGGSAPRRS